MHRPYSPPHSPRHLRPLPREGAAQRQPAAPREALGAAEPAAARPTGSDRGELLSCCLRCCQSPQGWRCRRNAASRIKARQPAPLEARTLAPARQRGPQSPHGAAPQAPQVNHLHHRALARARSSSCSCRRRALLPLQWEEPQREQPHRKQQRGQLPSLPRRPASRQRRQTNCSLCEQRMSDAAMRRMLPRLQTLTAQLPTALCQRQWSDAQDSLGTAPAHRVAAVLAASPAALRWLPNALATTDARQLP